MKNIFKGLIVCLLSICTLASCDSDKKYTVTEEEWNALVGTQNYTAEYYLDGELKMIEKYTEDVLQMDDNYVIFVGDKQYFIDEYKDYGLVATDCTYVGFEKGNLFAEYKYSDFKYDKESKSYVNIVPNEDGCEDRIRFENGLPVSVTCTYVDDSTSPATITVQETIYSNIGTTTVIVPEFMYESEVDEPYIRTVDEETWNSYKNVTNYDAYFYFLIDDEIEIYEAKVDGNKLLIDNQLYVVEDGKTYLLEEKDSKWVATETKLLDDWYYVSDFFNSFSFSDFTYDETVQEYIYSKEDENIIYSVYFTDGVLISFSIETTDENGKIHEVYYSVENFGNVTVEVPEYTKENS